MRMSRRMGLRGGNPVIPTLAELLADTTLLTAAGFSANNAMQPTLDISGIDTTTPYYVILSIGTAIEFVKISGTTATILNYNTTSVGLTVSSSQITASGTYYGFTFLAVRFPNYSTKTVDAVLGAITITRKAGRNLADAAYVSMASNSIDSTAIYLAAYGAGGTLNHGAMSFSSGQTIFVPIFTCEIDTNDQPSTSNNSILYQYFSNIYVSYGTGRTLFRNAGIWELTEAA